MNLRHKTFVAIGFVPLCLLLHFYCADELRVEKGYTRSVSPAVSEFLRSVFGWLPFSIGDLFYALLTVWLTWRCIRFCIAIYKNIRRPAKVALRHSLLSVFNFCVGMYLLFNLIWGINYDRKGIAWQLGLIMNKYSEADLKAINLKLLSRVNETKRLLIASGRSYPQKKQLYAETIGVYSEAAEKNSIFRYRHPSLKTSMWGWLGNYTGFTGYYNPFSGEAQVNTTVPQFLQPFIACHEVAHQLGYAKENEANFVAYLAVSASSNPAFQYSTYLDLFTYANRNLFLVDTLAARRIREGLDTAVVNDLKEWSAFHRRHENAVEPLVRWVYGMYLRGNRQPQGILSYDEVTAFIIAYEKKCGKI